MLEVLRISNFAIIEQVEVEFNTGLTVVTGETGAGKSIVMDALRLILGDRAGSDVVRTGASRATIEGIFQSSSKHVQEWLEESAFHDDHDEGRVIIRREINRNGSSRNFINGRSATLSQMRELGSQLVDLHGQNEHTALISSANQLQFLDNFGSNGSVLQSFRHSYDEYRASLKRLSELETGVLDADRKKSFLSFQLEEIEKAELKTGEDEMLETEKKRLSNAERLGALCQSVCDILYEAEQQESPAAMQLAAATKNLTELAQLDPSQEFLARDAEAARFAVVDLYERVRDYAASVQADPAHLSVIDDRLHIIRDLKKKYGPTIIDVIDTGANLAKELEAIENRDLELEKVRAELQQKAQQALSSAEKLSKGRRSTAESFEKSVQKVVRELELPRAQLRVNLESTISGETPTESDHILKSAAALTAKGSDTIEFLITLNAGEELRPLRKVASGGEMSRIMLAIKSVAAGKDSVPTLIFDEIDSGISGQAAARVGEKLSELGKSHQVICITHLPQIAARGDVHYLVEKKTTKGRTTTEIKAVKGDQRKTALAQMLSGNADDEESLRFAETLIEKARRSS